MGWEQRNDRFYYYEKHREGGRVVSQYVGTGPVAQMRAARNESEKQKRQRQREALRQKREALDQQAGQVIAVLNRIRALTYAAMIAAGYYMHKGQWRKRREHRRSR